MIRTAKSGGAKERKRTRLFNDISITSPTDRSTRRLYSSTPNIRHTCNHIEYVRSSMNSVHDAIYETFAELDGHNFSYYESQLAIKIVANRLFGRDWKLPLEASRKSKYEEDEMIDDPDTVISPIDNNTLPTRSAIRKKLKQIHAMSLGLIATRISEAKSEGAILTHATDSTTRKHVGSFAPAGVHINRDEYVPLPTLRMSSETTCNISEGIQTDFKLVAAAAGKEADELYANIDVHMTDSTAHNKGISNAVAESCRAAFL